MAIDMDELERIGREAAAAPWWESPREVGGRVVDSEIKGAAVIWSGRRVGCTGVCLCRSGHVTFEADRKFIITARNNWQAMIDEIRRLREHCEILSGLASDKDMLRRSMEAYDRGEYMTVDELRQSLGPQKSPASVARITAESKRAQADLRETGESTNDDA